MRNCVFLLYICLFLIVASGHGVSFDVPSNCRLRGVSNGVPCFVEQLSFTINDFYLTMLVPARIEAFQNSCNSLGICFSNLDCQEAADLTYRVTSYCSSMMSMQSFTDCFLRIRDSNSKCLAETSSQPGNKCNNPFGKGNCIKKEIEKTCGKQMWMNYRNTYLYVLTLGFPACNFDKFRNV